ncbi:hypothetical protein [Burkholderia cepacia]|uniref:hypothetical protein n=1 Tax=Burkholderia cepacia TaxID=292 RepID=UPI000753DED7|nr:hypothetical protein [Burkholderia cepacia]KVU58875.1 hypothetical protein WK70_13420 [Burkholderia cepacia]
MYWVEYLRLSVRAQTEKAGVQAKKRAPVAYIAVGMCCVMLMIVSVCRNRLFVSNAASVLPVRDDAKIIFSAVLFPVVLTHSGATNPACFRALTLLTPISKMA